MKVTVVSCYYIIKSKHPHSYYKNWIKNFFSTFKGNIIIFTNEETKKQVFKFIKYPKKKIKFIIQDLSETKICKKYDTNFWENQYKLDKPKFHGNRTKECYIIWNSKFNFLKEAIELNPFDSDKFIWNDIGSLRESKNISNYPNYEKLISEKLSIVCLNSNFDKQYYQGEVHFSGAIFGGGKEIILELCEKYYLLFQEYVEKNLFIGCDQQIICSLFIKNKEKFNLVTSSNWFEIYNYLQ